MNNCASLICRTHHKGTKTDPNEAEIRPQLEPQRLILQRFVTLQFKLQRFVVEELGPQWPTPERFVVL